VLKVLRIIPNLLSISRIFLLIPWIVYIQRNNLPAIIILSAIIIASDYFDGFLARRWQATSAAGKVLDPVADKICIAAAGAALVIFRDFPLYLLAALISRDLLILAAGAVLVKISGTVPASNTAGKISVGIISGCLLVFLFDFDFLKTPAIIITWIFILFSLVSYGKMFIDGLRIAKSNK
jgi:CDP-diacylglycerol--glycerol-3-phosphate 3-phosphatidyltransferase